MTIGIVPNFSNREPSDKLNSMLVDLENNTKAIFDSIEEIRTQARSEGFEDFETDLLLKPYLDRGMGRDRAKYILRDKSRKVLLKIWGQVPKSTLTMFLKFQHLIIIL